MKSIREIVEAWQQDNFTFIDLAAQNKLILALKARELEIQVERARLRAALENLSVQVCADVHDGIGDLVEVEKIIKAALAKEGD